MTKLTAPCAYQGGKSRIAKKLLDIIAPNKEDNFVDMCCGTGSVSLALINRGHPCSKISMYDIGLWGKFYELISCGNFDIKTFEKIISLIPKNPASIKDFLKLLSTKPTHNDELKVYIYLILQAGAFGSRAIWYDNGWKNASFRSYWLPTKTSNRRYPVNPMMPMPGTLLNRVATIVDVLHNQIVAAKVDVRDIDVDNSIVYIDPPYANTTGYVSDFDVIDLAKKLAKNNKVFVSENHALTNTAWRVSSHRAKGNMSGKYKRTNEEWLSLF